MNIRDIVFSLLSTISACVLAQSDNTKITILSSFPIGGGVTAQLQPNLHLKTFKALVETSTPNTLNVASGGTLQAGLLQVGDGRAQMLWTQSGYFLDKEFSFALFNQPPFITAQHYLQWRAQPATVKAADELYAKYGVKAMPCSIIDYGMDFVLTRKPDAEYPLLGTKMAVFGPARDIYTAAGLNIFPTPLGEVNQSMKMSVIDGANTWSPHESNLLRFDEFAKVLYFPSVVRSFTAIDLFINLKFWNDLSAGDRAKYESACQRTVEESLISSKRLALEGVEKNRKSGIDILPLPQSAVQSIHAKWREMASQRAAIDPVFDGLYHSLYQGSPVTPVAGGSEIKVSTGNRCEVTFRQGGEILKPTEKNGWAHLQLKKSGFSVSVSPKECGYLMASIPEAETINALSKLPEFVFATVGTPYAGTSMDADILSVPSRPDIEIPLTRLTADDRYLSIFKAEAYKRGVEPKAITPWGSAVALKDDGEKSVAFFQRLTASVALDSAMPTSQVSAVIYLVEKKFGGSRPQFFLIRPYKAVLAFE